MQKSIHEKINFVNNAIINCMVQGFSYNDGIEIFKCLLAIMQAIDKNPNANEDDLILIGKQAAGWIDNTSN